MSQPSLIVFLLAASLCVNSGAQAAPTKLSAEAFKPTIEAPGSKLLKRLGRKAGIKDALAHGKAKPLGGARFLGLISSRKKQLVHVLVVNGEGGKWRVLHRLVLRLTFSGDSLSKKEGRCHEDRVAAVGFVGDYDADGKREAKVRTLFCRVVSAIGPVKVRRLAMINLHGKPRVALHMELGYDALPTAMGAIRARERFKDLNGDGHPDLLVKQREAVFPPQGDKLGWKRSQRRFLYDPQKDSYAESKTKRKRKR